MDVNARIDRLPEANAKAALKWCVKRIAKSDRKYLTSDIDMDVMSKIILGDALLGARKETRE